MGFNVLDYKEVLSDLEVEETGKWNNVDGFDPYSYAFGHKKNQNVGGKKLSVNEIKLNNLLSLYSGLKKKLSKPFIGNKEKNSIKNDLARLDSEIGKLRAIIAQEKANISATIAEAYKMPSKLSLTNKLKMSNASGDDEYNYAGGCGVLHPFNSKKREECEKANLTAKTTETESDILLAKATLAKASQPQQAQMSPMAITGIIVGSLLAITVMVVVIKKVKANRG